MPTAVDDSPPLPSPSLNPFGLGFRTPANPPSSPFPSPSPSPEDTSPTLDVPEPDSGDEYDAASPPPSPDDTSLPASSTDAEAVDVELFDADDLSTLARGAVAFAGEKAHQVVATTEGRQQVGLLRTDEQDQAQIGDPLARIAARHQGVAGKVNPDTKDFLSSLVGLFSYGMKQVNRLGEARAIDAGAVAQQQAGQA